MTDCGGYYLGPPGHMIRIDGSHAGLARGWGSPVTVHDGGLAPSYAFRSTRRPRRQWRIGLDLCTPDEVAGLHELLMSPAASLVLVDPWAQVTNVLSPEASMFIGSPVFGDPLQAGGGYGIAGGGHVARHAINPSAQSGGEALVRAGIAPVRPGSTVTASTYVASRYGATVGIFWFGSSGSVLSLSEASAPAPADVSRLHRVSATYTVPAAAVGAGVVVRHGEYMARAALTWTPHALPWDVGGTALRCVLGEVEEGIEYAMTTPAGQRRTSSSVTVTEVGL